MSSFWLKGEPYSASRWTGRNRSGYAAALVCLHGHLVRDSLLRRPDLNALGYCTAATQDELTWERRRCGARIIGECLHCGARLRGRPTGPDVDMDLFPFYGDDTVSPDYQLAFCEHCGGSHPWSTREQRIRQLENLVRAQQLGLDAKADAVTALRKLEQPGLSEDAELALWRTALKHAPTLRDSVGQIAESLLTPWIRQQLGLP